MNKVRTEQIRERLQQRFSPQSLIITDDSHLHIGHTGSAGAGHFRVQIVAKDFFGLNRLQRHQAVFTALAPLMGTEIHALSIDAKSPEEGKNAE